MADLFVNHMQAPSNWHAQPIDGASDSKLQVNGGNGTGGGNQGISEQQLDQLLAQVIMALLQQGSGADQAGGDNGAGGTSGSGGQGQGGGQQAGQADGAGSPITQMLMSIISSILEAQNGGGMGGGFGGGSGGGLGVSLSSDTGATMQ